MTGPKGERKTAGEVQQKRDTSQKYQNKANSSIDPEKATELTRIDDIVDWDGPNDPENPHNWPLWKKTSIIGIVSAITFITPLASSVFAPSIEKVMEDFGSDNASLASFIVSVYLIGYCFGPLLIAPLSELYGRSPVYHICNVLFVIWSVACALAPNLASLIIFRLFSGLAGSCPITLGAGTLADMVTPEKHGVAMAAWVAGPLLGPVIGPLAGGYLTQAAGWRWSLWLVVIAAGVITTASFLVLQESYAYTILKKKTERLQKETGNFGLRSKLDNGGSTAEVFKLAIVRPTKMLLFAPIVTILSFYMAIIYSYLYLLFTAFPSLFKQQYGFDTGEIGLAYLGIGVGSVLGLFIHVGASDRLASKLKRENNGVWKPEYRLPTMLAACALIPAGLFWSGWTAETKQHWILPILGSGVFGVGLVLIFLSVSTYLVDAFGVYAASATAAATVFRALLGALLPLAGLPLFNRLGFGWGSSFLAFLAMAMIPMPFVFWKYGERIRRKVFFNVKF